MKSQTWTEGSTIFVFEDRREVAMAASEMYICDLCSVDRCNSGDFCYGCEEWVCNECDVGNVWGPHNPEDHLNVFFEEADVEYTNEDGEYE